MNMKKIALLMTACCLPTAVFADEKVKWLTDVPKAIEKAKAEKKLVLLDFTGSDWCPPCKALHKNVLTSSEFESYASTNLVLVEVDFPRQKEQTEDLKTANKALAKKYKIEGYPTVILLSAEGKELSKAVGYGGAKPDEFIATLEAAKNK
jgi:protein disulfide-isomerase